MGGSQGKLTAAAAWLLRPADAAAEVEGDDELRRGFMRLGVTAEQLDAHPPTATAGADDELLLWAWHLDAVRLFGAMRSQWLVAPRALPGGAAGFVYLGLNYVALPVVEQRLGLTPSRELFDGLQVLERAGRAVLND